MPATMIFQLLSRDVSKVEMTVAKSWDERLTTLQWCGTLVSQTRMYIAIS